MNREKLPKDLKDALTLLYGKAWMELSQDIPSWACEAINTLAEYAVENARQALSREVDVVKIVRIIGTEVQKGNHWKGCLHCAKGIAHAITDAINKGECDK